MFNEQQLKLIRDTIVEKLSQNEALDATHRSTFGTILAQVKERIQVLEKEDKRENRSRNDWNARLDKLTAEEQDHLEISFKK